VFFQESLMELKDFQDMASGRIPWDQKRYEEHLQHALVVLYYLQDEMPQELEKINDKLKVGHRMVTDRAMRQSTDNPGPTIAVDLQKEKCMWPMRVQLPAGSVKRRDCAFLTLDEACELGRKLAESLPPGSIPRFEEESLSSFSEADWNSFTSKMTPKQRIALWTLLEAGEYDT
jgi:hypothetical protein